MKKIIKLILCFCIINTFCLNNFNFAHCEQNNEEYLEGKIKGEMAADSRHSAKRYIIGGSITGFLFGLIGTGLGVGIVALTSPSLPPFYEDETKDRTVSYKIGFAEAYKKKAKSKNIRGFLYSGIVGSLIAGIIIASMQKND